MGHFFHGLTMTECLLALAVALAIFSLFMMTADTILGIFLFLNAVAIFLNVLDSILHRDDDE